MSTPRPAPDRSPESAETARNGSSTMSDDDAGRKRRYCTQKGHVGGGAGSAKGLAKTVGLLCGCQESVASQQGGIDPDTKRFVASCLETCIQAVLDPKSAKRVEVGVQCDLYQDVFLASCYNCRNIVGGPTPCQECEAAPMSAEFWDLYERVGL